MNKNLKYKILGAGSLVAALAVSIPVAVVCTNNASHANTSISTNNNLQNTNLNAETSDASSTTATNADATASDTAATDATINATAASNAGDSATSDATTEATGSTDATSGDTTTSDATGESTATTDTTTATDTTADTTVDTANLVNDAEIAYASPTYTDSKGFVDIQDSALGDYLSAEFRLSDLTGITTKTAVDFEYQSGSLKYNAQNQTATFNVSVTPIAGHGWKDGSGVAAKAVESITWKVISLTPNAYSSLSNTKYVDNTKQTTPSVASLNTYLITNFKEANFEVANYLNVLLSYKQGSLDYNQTTKTATFSVVAIPKDGFGWANGNLISSTSPEFNTNISWVVVS